MNSIVQTLTYLASTTKGVWALRESGAVVSHFFANNPVNNPDNAVLLFNNKGKADTLSWKSQGKKSP